MVNNDIENKVFWWKKQLLDTSRRNKMVSYRKTKASTLEIININLYELYNRLVINEEKLVFKKPFDQTLQPQAYALGKLLETLGMNTRAGTGDLESSKTLLEMNAVLKNMRSKAKLARDEQGMNILYLSMGFLKWNYKKNGAENWVVSPLIMVPVALEINSILDPYTLHKTEEDVVINPTLSYLLEKDYSMKLPPFRAERDDLSKWLQSVQEKVSSFNWEVLEEMNLGIVSFAKINMYKDLDDHLPAIRNNPVIQALCGQQNPANTVQKEKKQDASLIHIDRDFEVLPADSSQAEAIQLARTNVSFILQGPPGTGKSQTITNLIAQSLAEGKKILFVSEKQAALDVVYSRLQETNLADFCFPLHNPKVKKKQIIDQLAANESLIKPVISSSEREQLKIMEYKQEKLANYTEQLHKPVSSLKISPYEAFEEIFARMDIPSLGISYSFTKSLTLKNLLMMKEQIEVYESYIRNIGLDWKENPWNQYKNLLFTRIDIPRIRSISQLALDGLNDAAEAWQEVQFDYSEFEQKPESLSALIQTNDIWKIEKIKNRSQRLSEFPLDWIRYPHDEFQTKLEILANHQKELNNEKKRLLKNFSPEVFDHADQILTSKKSLESAEKQLDKFAGFKNKEIIYQQSSELYLKLKDGINRLNKIQSFIEPFNLALSYEEAALFLETARLVLKYHLNEYYFDRSSQLEMKTKIKNLKVVGNKILEQKSDLNTEIYLALFEQTNNQLNDLSKQMSSNESFVNSSNESYGNSSNESNANSSKGTFVDSSCDSFDIPSNDSLADYFSNSLHISSNDPLTDSFMDQRINASWIQNSLETIQKLEQELANLIKGKTVSDKTIKEIKRIDQIIEETGHSISDTLYRLNSEKTKILENNPNIWFPETLTELEAAVNLLEYNPVISYKTVWKNSETLNQAVDLLQKFCQDCSKYEVYCRSVSSLFNGLIEASEMETLKEDQISIYTNVYSLKEGKLLFDQLKMDGKSLLKNVEILKNKLYLYQKAVQDFNRECAILQIRRSNDLDNDSKKIRDFIEQFNQNPPKASWTLENQDLLRQYVSDLNLYSTAVRSDESYLKAHYSEGILDIPVNLYLDQWSTENRRLRRPASGNYRNNLKELQQLTKWKLNEDEILELLHRIKEYQDNLAEYQHLFQITQYLTKVEDNSVYFDWESYLNRVDQFYNFRKLFISNGAIAQVAADFSRMDRLHQIILDLNDLSYWFETCGFEKYFGSCFNGIDTNIEEIEQEIEDLKKIQERFSDWDLFENCQNLLKEMPSETKNLLENNLKTITEILNWKKENTGLIISCCDLEQQPDSSKSIQVEKAQKLLETAFNYQKVYEILGEENGFGWISGYCLFPINAVVNIAEIKSYSTVLNETRNGLQIVFENELIKSLFYEKPADLLRLDEFADVFKNVLKVIKQLLEETDKFSVYLRNDIDSCTLRDLETLLERLHEYESLQKLFNADQNNDQTLFGQMYQGINTSWEQIEEAIIETDRLMDNALDQLVHKFLLVLLQMRNIQYQEVVDEIENSLEFKNLFSFLKPLFGNSDKLFNSEIKLEEMSTAWSQAAEIINVFKESRELQDLYSPSSTTLAKWKNRLAEIENFKRNRTAYLLEQSTLEKEAPFLKIEEAADLTGLVMKVDEANQQALELSQGSFDNVVIDWLTNQLSENWISIYDCQFEILSEYKENISKMIGLFNKERKEYLYSLSLQDLQTEFQKDLDLIETIEPIRKLQNMENVFEREQIGEFINKVPDLIGQNADVKETFLKSVYEDWIRVNLPMLAEVHNFDEIQQDQTIETFRELYQNSILINRKRVRSILIERIQKFLNQESSGSQVNILHHESQKKAGHKQLRQLFREIPELLLTLKPCLMMSPLSVAKFLEGNSFTFDLVIFDEASQVFPQDAIGAIYRAKQVIIAGDTRQLPPTDFFGTTNDLSDDYDYDQEMDSEEYYPDELYDSILEEASVRFPSKSLNWHYRSKSENLINFSNKEIYQNQLITFPSVVHQDTSRGIDFEYVEDGLYMNQTNEPEARRVLKVLKRELDTHPKRSIGIIAFNKKQQALIEDEIQEFRLSNPSYERFFSENQEKPVFVKNLETVQGDERDTILFSIGYGRNENGKFIHNFGPLGKAGGERRLNVAITRAIQHLIVISSIHSQDIDERKINSTGGLMLKDYLYYAENGIMPERIQRQRDMLEHDKFIFYLEGLLKSQGYSVDKNVGESKYKIDLVVHGHNSTGDYSVAIECDGKEYASAKSIKDRDYLRPAVLKQSGWNLYRLWSAEWEKNPQYEKNKLLAYLKSFDV